MNSLWAPHLMDWANEATHSTISQNIYSYLKMFSMNAEIFFTIEDNKKIMNITNFINIYTNICTYIICDKNDSK